MAAYARSWDGGYSRHMELERLLQRTIMCQDKKSGTLKLRDPGSWRILNPVFSFSRGITGMLAPLGQHCRRILGTLDLRQITCRWILMILDPTWTYCRGILRILHNDATEFEDPLISNEFCFWFHKPLRCLTLSTLSRFLTTY